MSQATITHSTHTLAAEAFIKEFGNNENPIYAFAGRGYPWDKKKSGVEVVPEIFNSERTRIDTIRNILYAKRITPDQCHLMIKRYDWQSGVTYTAWDPENNVLYPSSWEDKGSPVVTVYNRTNKEYNVYLCISNNNGKPSTVCPDNSSGDTIFKNKSNYVRNYGSDEYTWKWLFTVSNDLMTDWYNSEFLPVPTEEEYTEGHKNMMGIIKNSDELNQIFSIDVIDTNEYHILSETNYTVENVDEWKKLVTTTVVGDGNSATVKLTLVKLSDTVTRTINNAERTYYKYRISGITPENVGNSYTYADIEYELGSTTDIMENKPQLHIVIDKSISMCKNVSYLIGARYVAVKAEYEDEERHDNFAYFPVDFTYRQVGLVKNLRNRTGNKIKTNDNISFYDIIKLNNINKHFVKDEIITGVLSGAYSTILHVEDNFDGNSTSNNTSSSSGDLSSNTALEQTLYVTNTSGRFDVGEKEYVETLKQRENSSDVEMYSSGNIAAYSYADVSTKFGDFIYIQNTLPITRKASQKEVFLFVIEL